LNNEPFPYYKPVEFKGYGLKVIGKYENDDWLDRDNKEWVVLYHGSGYVEAF